MLYQYYFEDKKTGELVTYSEAKRRFYSVKRNPLESIFDEYNETKIESHEQIDKPNFTGTVNI